MCLVSVIIPCFNSEEFITSAIRSVISQSYKNIEIIVVDDGSTDYSIEAVEKFSDKIKIIKQKNKGAGLARNRGLKEANGEYIKFLDADDLLHPKAIQEQVNQSLKFKDEDRTIVYGHLNRMNEDGSKIWKPKFDILNPKDDQTAFIVENNYIVTSCPLHRKKYLIEVGGFNAIRGEEQDLHLRMALTGIKFKYYQTLVYYYRSHDKPTRLASQRWSEISPQLGMHQLNNLENLILEKTSKLSTEVSKAFFNRHLNYAKNLFRIKNEFQGILHIEKALTYNISTFKAFKIQFAKAYLYFLIYHFLGKKVFLKLLKLKHYF